MALDDPAMRDPAPTAVIAPMEVRVFGGRLDGASQPIAVGQRLRVGHAFDHDLVLRAADTNGVSLVVTLEEADARVTVVGGTASMLGMQLSPGETAILPFYVPLTVGSFALAVGSDESARWDDVPALLASARVQPVEAPEAGEPAPSRTGHAAVGGWLATERDALARRLPFVTQPGFLLSMAAVLGVVGLAAPAYRTVEAFVDTPDAVASDLQVAGFPGLIVRRDALNRALVIEGRVADDRVADRLRQHVASQYPRATVRVTTADAAAAAVTSLLETLKVDGEAIARRDAIEVRTEFLPRDRLADLTARIRADLPDTGPLRFVRDPARGPNDLQYFFASDRFGLASLVDGNPGHIVTADGQYWFAGAMLPTGHRLLAVEQGMIRFERDGLVEVMRVTPTTPAAPSATTNDDMQREMMP